MNISRRKKIAMIFLLLLAPILGELVSGSAPPVEFFNPTIFLVLLVLYGGGALLIREAKVRWNLGWSVMLLAIAYGIIEEGLMAQSFFNHNHMDLGELAFYGRWLGTNWLWTIQLTLYHATISTLIPILATDLLFPETKNKPLLKKRGIVFWVTLLIIDIILLTAVIIIQAKSVPNPYIASPVALGACVVIVGILIYTAFKLRNKWYKSSLEIIKSPTMFFIVAMVFQLVNLFLPHLANGLNLPAFISVLLQLGLATIALIFVFRQIFNDGITLRHKVAIVGGTVMSLVAFAPIHLLNNKDIPMTIVCIVTFILFLVFRSYVFKVNRSLSIK